MSKRKTIIRGRTGRFVWHVFRPVHPTRLGCRWKRGYLSFSVRWAVGWVVW